jgi:hypothetical protein
MTSSGFFSIVKAFASIRQRSALGDSAGDCDRRLTLTSFQHPDVGPMDPAASASSSCRGSPKKVSIARVDVALDLQDDRLPRLPRSRG